jgi:hypothetical protein
MNKQPVLRFLISLVVLASMLLSSCGAPATTEAPVAPPTEAPAAPAATVAPATEAPTVAPAAAGPSCGTDPVVLNAYFETGFDIPFKLADEFTKQYPNVTWDIKQDQFANLITTTPQLLERRSSLEPGQLCDGVRLGQVARATAQPEPRRGRRHPWFRHALRYGSQL